MYPWSLLISFAVFSLCLSISPASSPSPLASAQHHFLKDFLSSLHPFGRAEGKLRHSVTSSSEARGFQLKKKKSPCFLSVTGNFNSASRIPRVRVLEDEEGSKDIELSDDPYDCIQLSVENVPCIVTLCKVWAYISWFFLPCQSPPTVAR